MLSLLVYYFALKMNLPGDCRHRKVEVDLRFSHFQRGWGTSGISIKNRNTNRSAEMREVYLFLSSLNLFVNERIPNELPTPTTILRRKSSAFARPSQSNTFFSQQRKFSTTSVLSSKTMEFSSPARNPLCI